MRLRAELAHRSSAYGAVDAPKTATAQRGRRSTRIGQGDHIRICQIGAPDWSRATSKSQIVERLLGHRQSSFVDPFTSRVFSFSQDNRWIRTRPQHFCPSRRFRPSYRHDTSGFSPSDARCLTRPFERSLAGNSFSRGIPTKPVVARSAAPPGSRCFQLQLSRDLHISIPFGLCFDARPEREHSPALHRLPLGATLANSCPFAAPRPFSSNSIIFSSDPGTSETRLGRVDETPEKHSERISATRRRFPSFSCACPSKFGGRKGLDCRE